MIVTTEDDIEVEFTIGGDGNGSSSNLARAYVMRKSTERGEVSRIVQEESECYNCSRFRNKDFYWNCAD